MATQKSRSRSKSDKPTATSRQKGSSPTPKHEAATTDRPEDLELEGLSSLPEELTGRASRTDENLATLFDNQSAKHMSDGFHGGSGDDGPVLDQTDGPGDVTEEEE